MNIGIIPIYRYHTDISVPGIGNGMGDLGISVSVWNILKPIPIYWYWYIGICRTLIPATHPRIHIFSLQRNSSTGILLECINTDILLTFELSSKLLQSIHVFGFQCLYYCRRQCVEFVFFPKFTYFREEIFREASAWTKECCDSSNIMSEDFTCKNAASRKNVNFSHICLHLSSLFNKPLDTEVFFPILMDCFDLIKVCVCVS